MRVGMNLEVNKIYNMDCLEGMKELEDNSIDLCVTDPPYNIGKDKWDYINNYYNWIIKVFKEVERVLKENGTLWFFHINFIDLVEIHKLLSEETNFRHKQFIIINKGMKSVGGRCNMGVLRSFPRATEYLQFYFFQRKGDTIFSKIMSDNMKKFKIKQIEVSKLILSKNNNITGWAHNKIFGKQLPTVEQWEKICDLFKIENKYNELIEKHKKSRYLFKLPLNITDVWNIDFYKEKSIKGHLTVKPVYLLRRIIKTVSKKGDIVLDPFIGSGTTMVACHQLGRKFIGYEINKKYYDMARARLKKSMEQLRVFGFESR